MANNVNEDDLVVPCKKLRKESSGIDNEDFGSIPSGTSSHFPNTHGVTVFSKTSESEPGRHLRFHSVEQDDVQSSSGNSSNVENDSQNDEDSGNLSDSSSHASSGDWQRRPTGMMGWVQAQMLSGVDPREIIQHLVPSLSSSIPADINPFTLWKLILNIMSEPQRRPKLSHINTLSDVVNLIKNAKNILVLTGAGVSVSCGIPDFRSRDGIYARLAVDFPDLPDPQAMFDISYFTQDPRPFFKFAKEIYPGQFKPSRGHRFISLLQKTGRLLRNYTQNIDTLEQVSGISKVIQCHGSFATASCLKCEYKVDCEVVREDIFNMKVPRCPQCPPDEELAIMKPDIVFFGESLPEHFHRQMSKDKHDTDLLIVIGSSLKVRPVALIPSSLPDHVPQILINREPLPHVQFDVELLGDGDTIVAELCKRLGPEFSEIAEERELLEEIDTLPDENSSSPSSQSNSDESIPKNNEIKTENKNENSCSTPKYETLQSSSTNDKNNNSSLDSEKILPNATDDISCQINSNGSKSEVSSSESNQTISSAIENREINEHKSSTESSGEHETKQDTSENDLPTTSNEEKNSTSEAEEVPKKCYNNMWKSRWKQSISKRLPAGTFYYDGKFRYIFPGAEVAPEEVDDDDDSDTSYDDDIGDTNQSSSSSDESEEDVKGPGGLSSTKRDLRSITMRSNHHHHHFRDLTSSCIHDHDDSDEINDNTQVLSNSTTDEDKKLHNSEADKTHSESESIIPDELHEDIIELSSSTRSHSPLPESLHKILSTEHLHDDKHDTLLGKPVTEIPDTAQILDLPSSSLLPPISRDYPIRTNHQNSESENKKSEEDATSLSSHP